MMNITKIFAGSVIMTSVLLAHFYSEYWLFLTFFVGLNLFQFGLTNFCTFEIGVRRWELRDKKTLSEKSL